VGARNQGLGEHCSNGTCPVNSNRASDNLTVQRSWSRLRTSHRKTAGICGHANIREIKEQTNEEFATLRCALLGRTSGRCSRLRHPYGSA
jgi:hypothetical protein